MMASKEPKIALDEVEAEYRRLCSKTTPTNYVALRDMASMMGVCPSALRKYTIKRGFKTVRMRYGKGPQPWQVVVALTTGDAKRMLRQRKKEGLIPGGVLQRERKRSVQG